MIYEILEGAYHIEMYKIPFLICSKYEKFSSLSQLGPPFPRRSKKQAKSPHV
jgi:hypothetical protein